MVVARWVAFCIFITSKQKRNGYTGLNWQLQDSSKLEKGNICALEQMILSQNLNLFVLDWKKWKLVWSSAIVAYLPYNSMSSEMFFCSSWL